MLIASTLGCCSNNAGIVGLAYTQALRPGVKASFGIAIDTQRLNDREWLSPSGICYRTDSLLMRSSIRWRLWVLQSPVPATTEPVLRLSSPTKQPRSDSYSGTWKLCQVVRSN